MRERWRDFAARDPMFYIAANRDDWTTQDFLAQGSALVDDVLDWAGDTPRKTMLEIGCGLGRMLVHFARHFETAYGVDIAPEMIDRARELCPTNVRLSVGSGRDLSEFHDAMFDFAFCVQVFQHIPDREVISRYLREIRRTLRPGASAVVQFDTRPYRTLERIAFRLPDFALPRTRRRYIRRYRLDVAEPAALAAAAGLEIVDQRDPGAAEHFLLLRRR
jgi:ubiquinone/menaquinone biosynthesis C-methylase UbiE